MLNDVLMSIGPKLEIEVITGSFYKQKTVAYPTPT